MARFDDDKEGISKVISGALKNNGYDVRERGPGEPYEFSIKVPKQYGFRWITIKIKETI